MPKNNTKQYGIEGMHYASCVLLQLRKIWIKKK